MTPASIASQSFLSSLSVLSVTPLSVLALLGAALFPTPLRAEIESETPTEERARQVTTTRRAPGVPTYQYRRPEWAFELAGASKAFRGSDLLNVAGGSAYAVSFQVEYQPQIVQSLGIIGFGPSIAFYPISGEGVTNSQLDIWSAGGQIRYQARFFREQVIVPMAGYSFERIGYAFTSGAKGSLTAKGTVLGVLLLLNPFDESATADFFVNTGITRSYLVAEYRDSKGTGEHLSLSKGTFYFGLRLEM